MAVRLLTSTVFLLIIAHSAAWSQQDEIWNARMNMCVQLLKPQDSTLRNAWRGHCGDTEVDEQISNSTTPANRLEPFTALFSQPRATVSVQPADCGRTPSLPPVARSQSCGLGSATLYQNLSSAAAVQIRLPGNKCIRFIPILLTNKTDFACNAVQSRIACIDTKYDRANDRTTITFSTRRGGKPDTTTIVVGAAEMAATQGHLDDLIKHPQFALMPAMSGTNDVLATLKSTVGTSETQCRQTPGKSAQTCHAQVVTHADALLQEQLRRYRNPKRLLSKADSQHDAAALVADIKAYYGSGHLESWLLFLSLAANEVGLDVSGNAVSSYDPAYALSDAVYDNSGLTFGAHQIDLAANSAGDVQLLWDIVAAYNLKNPADILKQAAAMQSCIDLPLRSMTVLGLQLTYQVAPKINDALRSSDGIKAYDGMLKTFLDQKVEAISSLPGFFQHSMVSQILYTDLENQYGSGQTVTDLVTKLVKPTDNLNDCRVITQDEDKILDALIFKNPDDPSKGKTTYASRYKNIRTIVRSQAPNAGRMQCT